MRRETPAQGAREADWVPLCIILSPSLSCALCPSLSTRTAALTRSLSHTNTRREGELVVIAAAARTHWACRKFVGLVCVCARARASSVWVSHICWLGLYRPLILVSSAPSFLALPCTRTSTLTCALSLFRSLSLSLARALSRSLSLPLSVLLARSHAHTCARALSHARSLSLPLLRAPSLVPRHHGGIVVASDCQRCSMHGPYGAGPL